MAGLNGAEQVAVNIGECRCSSTPHPDGDVVYLAAHASMRLGLAANAAIAQATELVEMNTLVGLAFIRYGVKAWNLLDDKGQPVEVTPDAVEARLRWDAGGREVADKAADLYTEAVLGPLVQRAESSPPPGPTEPSTSPSLSYSPPPPISFGPSSPENSAPST